MLQPLHQLPSSISFETCPISTLSFSSGSAFSRMCAICNAPSRNLKTDNLPDCWNALDSRLAVELKRLSAGRPEASDAMGALVKLLARFGSLGVVVHANCSLHAQAAAQDNSDAILAPLLRGSARRDQRNTSPEPETFSQVARCSQILK